MTRTVLGSLALSAMVSGCGALMTPPVLQVPIGQAALVYADAKSAYVVLSLQVRQACERGAFKADVCADLKTQDEVIKVLDADVRKSILEAQGVIDWAKVMAILQAVAGLAVKAGGL